MRTVRQYEHDVNQKSCNAVIQRIFKSEGGFFLVADRTVFFPEGGGQPGDRGIVRPAGTCGADITIIDTLEKDGEVWHRLADEADGEYDSAGFETELAERGFVPGAEIELVLDWTHRFDCMQRHLGEHILSGAIYRLFGGVNRGFHMGEDCITIDIAFEDEAFTGEFVSDGALEKGAVSEAGDMPHRSGYTKMTWEMAEAAEAEANRVIQQDLPVTVSYFETQEDAASMPLRKAVKAETDVSVVTVGDIDSPADCCACCGTHPDSSGQVGLVKIYKIEPNRGMSRIYFECGMRAFTAYQKHFNILYELENELSAGDNDVLAKFEARIEKENSLHRELTALRKKNVEQEAAALLSNGCAGVHVYDDLTADDLRQTAKKISGKFTGLAVLVSIAGLAAVLVSDGSADCGFVVKEQAAPLGGKGGGNKSTASCVFPDKAALDEFIRRLG